jgi:NAD(P)-dependent dehydrogenase (short-subunit alcohol dehydrogenase family)
MNKPMYLSIELASLLLILVLMRISNKEPKSMSGRVTLITGASSGIGRATSIRFAREGSIVVLLDRDDDGGLKTANQLDQIGIKNSFYHCDITNLPLMENTFSRIIHDFGRIDHVFNNAGIEGDSKSIVDEIPSNWDHVIKSNLNSVWHCMRLELQQMRKQGFGTIVNCSSIAGKIGFPDASAYVASKHGVIGITKVAALENARFSIRVNAVCPGFIETPMINRLVSKHQLDLIQVKNSIPMKRLGTPEEVADTVWWLSSDYSSYITGHSLDVDGGFLCR